MVINTQEFVVNELLYSPEGEEADIACFNITFADKFGHEKKKDNKKMKELEFLRQQQIIIQEYINEPKEKKSWQIFCLCDLKKPIFSMNSDDQKTQQVQFFVNVKIYNPREEIVLIVINLNT